MTWEYLIGSEKDFEGAPDWCTHVSEGMHSGVLSWEQDSVTKKGNRYQFKRTSSIGIYKHVKGCKINIVAQRRKREPKQWDGVGLPPVGCECEALIPYLDEEKHQWRKVKVVCDGDEFNAVGELIVVDLENTRPYWTDGFRPLRTKEQIEMDEMKNDLALIIGKLHHGEVSGTELVLLVSEMHKKGYRKAK